MELLIWITVVAIIFYAIYCLETAPTVDENENPIAGPGLQACQFPEANTTYAADQPQYIPLHAYRHESDPTGQVITCWKLTRAERLQVLLTGRLWVSVLTFRQPLQPLYLSVYKRDVLRPTPAKEPTKPANV